MQTADKAAHIERILELVDLDACPKCGEFVVKAAGFASNRRRPFDLNDLYERPHLFHIGDGRVWVDKLGRHRCSETEQDQAERADIRLHDALRDNPDLAELKEQMSAATVAVPYDQDRHAAAKRAFFERCDELGVTFSSSTHLGWGALVDVPDAPPYAAATYERRKFGNIPAVGADLQEPTPKKAGRS